MATTIATPDITAPEAAPAASNGPLASLLTAVEPARPVQPIGSTASMAEESIGSADSKPGKQAERNSGPVREHPVGALVRAIAARIGRTGTQNTIKRQHTITESRVSGGSTNTTNANRSNRDAKHHQIGQHRTARDEKVADNNSKIRQHQGRDQRDVKSHDIKASTDSKASKQDHASKSGRDVKDHKDAKSGTTTNKQDVVHQTSRDGLDGRIGKDAAKGLAPKKDAPVKDSPAAGAKSSSAKPDNADTPKTTPADKTLNSTKPETKPRPRTQPSRDAGYHDGTVAAKLTGHVKAYRDGARDGYADGTVEYEQEKRRMDDAKARNAIKPKAPAKPDMKPASGSTVDLAKNEQQATADTVPVQLTGLSETHIAFDADGASNTLSRAEVRTLRGFEQRIAAKRDVLQRVAEGSKVARKRAAEHATRAQQLAEVAKTVKGGDRLVGKLLRLAEQAQALQARTEEVEKHAHRGAEAVNVLVANANTRHGGIYKAVVDSPLTSPAEREFYQDKGGN